MNFFVTQILLFLLIIGVQNGLAAQDNSSVQVKVYDLQLNPVPNIQLQVEDTEPFNTNTRGIAFQSFPGSILPPTKIKISNPKLEAESWNYSKGILEVIIRPKSDKQLIVRLLEEISNKPLDGKLVRVSFNDSTFNLSSDKNGNISFTLPNIDKIEEQTNFIVVGYEIIDLLKTHQKWSLILTQEQTKSREKIQQIKPQKIRQQSKPIEIKNVDLSLDYIDSITSITVFYSMVKNVDYKNLSPENRIKIDEKFNQLLSQEFEDSKNSSNPLYLITDSSLINDDIDRIIERAENEFKLLEDFRTQFEKGVNEIREKLQQGGQNLTIDERKQLVDQTLNLRSLLRKNEELFYKNNAYYNTQVDELLSRLANIYELEDLLTESEEMSSNLKERLIISFLTLMVIIIIMVLLLQMIKIFKTQKKDLVKANKEIKRINDNLEGLIFEKTKSLEHINNELDTFLYRSSHNMKGPLTTIRGLANIAKITLDHEANQLFEKVVITAGRLENILKKLNMVSHLNDPNEFVSLDLDKICTAQIKKYEPVIKRRGIDFDYSIEENIEIYSCPDVLNILLSNCLENAFYFSQFNKEQKPIVKLKIVKEDTRTIAIDIEDNGCGIKKDVIEKVWDMFYIGIEISKGDGLGLYISKKAVDQLSGSISVNSSPYEYTKIHIKIPVNPTLIGANIKPESAN